MNCERHIEAIERDAAVRPAFDMEDQRHVAHALGWSRGQGGGLRHEARTYDAAIAILEIVSRKMPLNLVCHRALSSWPGACRWPTNELQVHRSKFGRSFGR